MNDQIALKSINQYRKRDILAYLSLRYYLDSTSSRTDLWAREVAVDLTIKNDSLNIFKTKHFKGIINDKIEYRDIYLLAPNDLISESALITECSKHEIFHTEPCVYSYLFSDDTKSVFQHYTNGLNDRFSSIKKACEDQNNEEVIYLDIKSFYPSISIDEIQKVWLNTCKNSQLPDKYLNLGNKFISKYKEVQRTEDAGLIIGPMFSHLLANLYLKEIDIYMNTLTQNRYWRYVDDIVLIGSQDEIKKFTTILTAKIEALGLNFHKDLKFFKLTTKEWLSNKNGIDHKLAWRWPKLIGLIKKYIISQPNNVELLNQLFQKEEIRLEPLTYASEVNSESLSWNFLNWLKSSFYSIKTSKEEILQLIESTTIEYKRLFQSSFNQTTSNDLEEKNKTTKLKYLTGRLIYLAKEKDLKIISKQISSIPELKLQFEIIDSLITADISRLVELGTNACQAGSQVLKQKHTTVTCKLSKLSESDILALAIFKFHGLEITFEHNNQIDNELYQFASGDIHPDGTNTSPYLHEFISLHGNEPSKHEQMLTSLYDENESFSFDVLNAGAGSSYY